MVLKRPKSIMGSKLSVGQLHWFYPVDTFCSLEIAKIVKVPNLKCVNGSTQIYCHYQETKPKTHNWSLTGTTLLLRNGTRV